MLYNCGPYAHVTWDKLKYLISINSSTDKLAVSFFFFTLHKLIRCSFGAIVEINFSSIIGPLTLMHI
jgi:hypothetical protein